MEELLFEQEQLDDIPVVQQVIQEAFAGVAHSNQKEQVLVARLRKSPTFIPALSLVARLGKRVIGYVLLTPITIDHAEKQVQSLAVAPLAITPVYQGKNIGTYLMQAAHRKALELGYGSVVVLGMPSYYQRLGYKMARDYGIQIPFDPTGDNSLVLEIVPHALQGVQGVVQYPSAFYE